MASSPWLHSMPRNSSTTRDGDPEPAWLNLFCFAHAGGGDHAFANWPEGLPANVQLVGVRYPGRGARIAETPIDSMADLVAGIVKAIEELCSSVPFAFFGHSLGAPVAFEVAKALEARGLPAPKAIFASSHPAPSICDGDRSLDAVLSGGDILEAAFQFGLLTPEHHAQLEADPSLRAVMLPPLKADLTIAAKYLGGPDKIQCPIVALGGKGDDWCPTANLAAWAKNSTSPCKDPTMFAGDHFYLFNKPSLVLKFLSSELETLITTLPRTIMSGCDLVEPWASMMTKPMHKVIEENVHKYPDRIALEEYEPETRKLTYAQMWECAKNLARVLQSAGVDRCTFVGSYMSHTADLTISNVAAFMAGGGIFPLETGYTADLITHLCNEVKPKVVVTDPKYAGNLPDLGPNVLVVILVPGWFDDESNFADLPAYRDPKSEMSDPAYATMTSGSTGRPKAVLNSHLGCTHGHALRYQLVPYKEGEREGHNVFFVWDCLRALGVGRTSIMIPDTTIYDPRLLVKYMKKHKIHRFMINGSLLGNLLDSGVDLSPLSHMTAILLCGEVVTMKQARRWCEVLPHVGLYNNYSTWESLDVTYLKLNRKDVLRHKSIYAPVAHAKIADQSIIPLGKVYVTNEALEPVPEGVLGQIVVASPGLAIKYLGEPKKTAARFVQNTFGERVYLTGDLGVQSPSGLVEVKGRADNTVKIRAFKVSLQTVESSVMGIESVGAVKVLPVLDPETKQPVDLAAYLVLKAQSEDVKQKSVEDRVRDVRDALKEALPEYAVPRYFIPLEKFPVKEGGGRKLDTKALPDPIEAAIQFETKPSTTATDESAAAAVPLTDNRLAGILTDVFKEVLGVERLGRRDNFFDHGGHSLKAATLSSKLSQSFGIAVSVLDIFTYPTVEALGGHIASQRRVDDGEGENTIQEEIRRPLSQNDTDIVVVGMAGSFPGATSTSALWDLLCAGKCSARRLAAQELQSKGIPSRVYNHPDYIPVVYANSDADKFDSFFWGINQREATVMDPQHRVFMETAWSAVENAGYAPRTGTPSRTGVWAACGIDGYLHIHQRSGHLMENDNPGGVFLTEVGNEKDYIATRVSYQLDCQGPAVNVQSACSSGLVAICQAATALATGQCDMAIAGASALSFPNFGYLYQEGLVGSTDGFVRPFGEDASGTVFGDAVGAVVLKRRVDAEADGDNILCSVKGWAISNDGKQKAGYSAPSSRGQSLAIKEAMRMAKAEPNTLQYIESHATATLVGDGIEVAGLVSAYRELGATPAKTGEETIALGSIKGNIGHANCAAGVTGFVKTVMSLQNKKIVPTACLDKVNVKIKDQLRRSPFHVHTESEVVDWPEGKDGAPRRGAVSSFGIGGTNAHIVMEEYRPPQPAEQVDSGLVGGIGGVHLLTVSGKTEDALRSNALELAEFLRENEDVPLSKIAYTLHIGREEFEHRAAVACSTHAQGALRLEEAAASPKPVAAPPATAALCFPGQGSQYLNMGKGLYKSNSVFREAMDRCAEIASEMLGFNFVDHLYPDLETTTLEEAQNAFKVATVLQPSLFAVEYSTALLLSTLGVKPSIVCGHSIGEYVAATLSGVLTLEDAVRIVVTRADATENDVGPGTMVSVRLPSPEFAIREFVETASGVSLAAANSPVHVTLSGTKEALDSAKPELEAQGCRVKFLNVHRAFHSPMMEEAAKKLVAFAETIECKSPSIPMPSNVTGSWLQDEACEPEYWGRHMIGTVEFLKDLDCLLKWRPDVLIEAGPGETLSILTGKACAIDPSRHQPKCFQTLRSAKAGDAQDEEVFVGLLGSLWETGVEIDWKALHRSEEALVGRTPLPTYNFEKKSFWVNPSASIYVDNDELPVEIDESGLATPDSPMLMSEYESGFSSVNTPSDSDGESSVTSPCFVRVTGFNPTAKSKMYCFPFAGGSAASFMDWTPTPGSDVEVIAIEIRGRGERADEEVPTTDEADKAAVLEIADGIQRDLSGSHNASFALVGFSAGALMALEVYKALPKHVQLRLVSFTVAGRAPLVAGRRHPGFDDFAEYILASEEVQASPAWTEYFEPLLKADLGADERAYNRLAETFNGPILSCPVLTCCGIGDPALTQTDAAKWAGITTSAVHNIAYFPGDHSFMNDFSKEIFGRIQLEVRSAVALNNVLTAAAPVLAAKSHVHRVRWTKLGQTQLRASTEPREGSLVSTLGADPASDVVAALRESNATELILVSTSEEDGIEQNEKQAWNFMQLVQEIIGAGLSLNISLILPASTQRAMAAGVSKSVALEFPELKCRRIFVSPEDIRPISPNWAATILNAVPADETDIWLQRTRGSRWTVYAQRLTHCPILSNVPPSRPCHFTPGEKIIFTGGTGALGTALVDWLIDQQNVDPTDIVLLSRSERTHPRGARIVVTDMSSRDALLENEALATLDNVSAVFHLAGVLDDGLVTGMTNERLGKVVAPKAAADGLLALAEKLNWSLRFFLNFSSTSSLLGYAGQSNYCAANAYLDALATWGSSLDCPILTINWGPWGEVGMAKKGTRAYELAVKDGDKPMSNRRALGALAAIINRFEEGAVRGGGEEYAVCDVSWARSCWRNTPAIKSLQEKQAKIPRRRSPRSSRGSKSPMSIATPQTMRKNASPKKKSKSTGKYGKVEHFLGGLVPRWMPAKRLTALGVDSLDRVQMRGQFNREFGTVAPLALFMKPNQTLGDLANSLSGLL